MSLPAQENTQRNSDTKYDFQRFGSLKVSQAAKILDISPSSLRRFEEEGRITSERSSGNNYRTYRLDLVNRLKAELKNEDNNKQLLVEKKKLKKVQRHSSKKINADLIKTEPKIIPSTPILNMDIPSVPYYVKPYVPISPSTKKLDVSIKTKDDKEEDSNLPEVTPSYEKMVTYKPAVSRLSFGRTLSLVSALLLVSILLLFPINFSRFFSDFKSKVQNGLANVKDLPNVLSILNIRSGKLTENKAATPSELLANVLAASARVSNYVFNFNIPVFFKKPVTFEDTLTANQLATFNAGIATTNVTFKGTGLINNLLGIDTVTKTTLERELDIDGQVTSTGMGNTIINNGVITGPMLNSNISYSGKFNFAGTIALKGTTITSTAVELNQLAGLAYESGGIFYGDGAGFYQDTSYLFWDSVNKNLGIGTSSPTATLEIISSGTGTSTSTLWTKNSLGITGLFVQNIGNVGIGTTAPATALEIGGIGNLRIGGLTPLSGVYTDANNTLVSAPPTSGALGYWQRNSTNLSPSIITDNVGIGTTAPGSKLSVAGGASIGLTYAGTSAPSNGMIIEGNVGIGTTGPSELLHLSKAGDTAIRFQIQIDESQTSSGPNSPGTTVDDATVGTATWSNPNNAKVSDNLYASVGGIVSVITHYLKATNFGFSIPSGATIKGILVEIEKSGGNLAGKTYDETLRIVKADGSFGTTNKADTLTSWPTPINIYDSYGGETDLWDESWDADKINDINFGVALSADARATGVVDGHITCVVDHIRITIYYTTASGGANWAVGADQSDGGKFKISGSSALGTTDRLTIDSSGNVGIGTTAPVNKLDVFGGMAIGSYAGVNTAPSNGLLVSGSVGIGTTSPSYTLDVNGTSRTTGEMTGGASLTLTNDIIARDQLRIGDADNTIFNYIANSVLGASTAMTSNIDLYIQGNLEVGGNVVTGTGSGTFGYWTRDSETSTISPVYSGDVVRIPGPFTVENSSTVKTTSSTAFIVQSGSSANTFVVDTAGNIVNVYGTINTTGAISAPTNTNTINGLVINTGNITSGTWNGDNISLGRGGTGASLTDPNADRIMFWDDSANSTSWLTAGSGLYLSETNPGAVTLNIGAGDGIIVSATSVAVNLSTSGTSPTTSSNSGLEVASTGLRMLGGCSSAQILSWNASLAKWECQTITGMPGVITGLGAAGQVTFWTGETSLTGSDNFFWNNGTGKLGLGTTNPTSKLTITPSDAAAFQINPFGAGAGSTGELRMLELVSNGTNYTGFKAPDSLNDDVIYTLPSSSAPSADYILTWQGGNVLQWKEVTGVGGAGDITSVGSTISGAAFSDSTATNQWLGLGASAGRITFIDATPDYINFSDANVGIGTTAPAYPLEVNGSVLGGGVLLNNSGDIGFGAVDPDLISLASGAVTINGTLTTTGAINGLTISSGNITAGTWGGDVISVPYGGTGAVTLGAHSVLLGAGTGPVTALTAGETGQLLLGVTGANPIFAAMSGDATITNSGALTLASTSVVAGTYGNSTNIPQITVDNKGRITAVANQAISYESPLTFTNGLTRTDNDVHLGGVLSENTRIYSSSGPDILFLDNTNSRVGIGTTTPSALLNIVSDSSDNLFLIEKTDGFDLFRVVGQSGYTEATGDLVSGGYGYWMKNFAAPQRFYIGHTTTTEPSIVVNASGAVSFHSYGTQPLVLNTEYGGNVGIGTTSPGAALEVSNTTLPQFRIRYDATRYMDVSNNGIFNLVSANVNDYNFQIEGTSKLFIQHTTGNVGIGTTNPISLLSVGAASQFQVNSTGNIVLLNNVITSFPSSQGVAGSLMTNDGAGVLSWAPPSGTGTLGYWTRTGTNLYNTNQGDNVGIGTTSPGYLLDLAGTGNLLRIGTSGSAQPLLGRNTSSGGLIIDTNGTVMPTNSLLSVRTGGGTDVMTVLANGNVGIGTTSPLTILQINNVDPIISLNNTNAYHDLGLKMYNVGGTPVGSIVSDGATGAVRISAYAALNAITIKETTGNIGIGTTNPISMLSVGASSQFQVNSTGNIVLLNNVITSFPSEQGAAGSIMTNNGSGTLSWGSPSGTGVLGYWTRTGTNLYNTNQADNVGIGTTNPANVLDIGTGGGIHITTGIPGSTAMALYNNSGTLTWNGVALATGGSSISGTTNYIPVFTGAATLGNSVIYQSSGNVGIGTTSPTGILNVLGDTTSSGPGSPITLTGGVGRWGASYAGGAINLTGGAGSYGGGNTGTNNGGNVNITGGTAGTYGYGGNVVLTAGSDGGGLYASGNIVLQGGNVGIETLGPTSILSLGGTAARIFGMERNITTNSIGNNLTIRAGGATSGMVSTISIINGGTGGTYAVNDVLTLATPIGGTVATVTVTSVTAGVINGVSLTTKGAGYTTGAKTTTVAPAGGTGAVINVSAVGSATNKAGGNLLLSSGISTGTGGSEIQFWTAPVGSTGATDNALTQKMVITAAGNVGIGTTNPLYTLTVNGTSWTTNNAWAGSDARWKTNVQPIAGALDKVLLLTGVSYNWRSSEFPQNNFDNKTHLGLIAQDVENIIPELVTTGADSYKGIDYNGFSALLINAIGEQQTQIGSLTGQLSNLSLPSTSDLQILRSGSSPLSIVINTTTGESIDNISAFAQSVIGELKAGSISTQELNAELVNIGGQSLQDYIGKIYLTASTDTIGIGTTSPSDTTSSFSEPSASGSSPSGINILDLDGVIRINQSVITDTVSNTLYNNSDVLMWNDKQISAGPNLYSINGPVSNDEYLTLQHKQGTTDILVTAWVNDGTKWVKITNIGDSSDTTDDYYFTTPDKGTVRLHNKSGHSQSLKLDVFVSGADVAEWYTPEDTTADTPATTSAGTPTDTTISSDTAAASDITTGSTPSTEIIPSGTSPDTSIITTPADSTFAPSTEGTDTSDIKSGDIVAISTSIDDYGVPMVRKTNAYNDSALFGVVTTSASHEMGIQRDGRKLVALSGRVPVKIDPASPDIKPGDFLTASSLDGYAIKAEMPGRVIGTALQSWNKDSGDEKILVLVNPTYNSPTSLTAASTSLSGSSTSGDILNELLTLRDQIITLSNNLKDTISSLGMTLSKDEITGKDVLAVNSDMHILGDVTLANLTVTGDVQAGMVTIDTLFNSINVLGSSCYNSEIGTIDNTLCNDQALHLQKSGSGMIDMFDGKIVAKPDGTLVVENSIETKKLVINTSDVASAAAGKATIKSGDTRITINTSAVNDKSIIMITPERPVAVGSKYKEVGKFEIILKEAQTEDLNVSWVIVDRKD